jgi:hypothetical protein
VAQDAAEELAAALAAGHELDVGGREVPATALADVLTAPPPPGAPVLRLRQARVTGVLRLTGARIGFPVDLRGCRFDEAPDLRMAELVGLSLSGCRVPALRAGNLRVAHDLLLDDGFTSHGPVALADAQVGGSLRLSAARLLGTGGRALIADRLVVGGTCYARRLRSGGELRMPGARITGNLDLAGAVLSAPGPDALDVTGIAVTGSVLAGRHPAGPEVVFRATGRVLMAGARIGGDLLLTGAVLRRDGALPLPGPPTNSSRPPLVPEGAVDPGAALVADRIRVEGDLELDGGAVCVGTVRLPGASVGGFLRLSGAQLAGPHPGDDPGVALLGDGLAVGGDLEARRSGRPALVCRGTLRLVDAQVRGSAGLSGARLLAPHRDALHGDRLRVGGELALRDVECAGTVRLQNAAIGTTLDCVGTRFAAPRHRPLGADEAPADPVLVRPSLDLRSASIGKDLLALHVVAPGGVRLRRADVGKSVQLQGAVLGGPGARYALNAYGLVTTELDLRPGRPPDGVVLLDEARVGRFLDAAPLWEPTTRGHVSLEGFVYESLGDTPPVDVHQRVRWVIGVSDGYSPRSLDQLAAAYRRHGQEEKAETVLVARQRQRYRGTGPTGRTWGFLQRVTVGYGYRPWLAVCWLAGLWVLGGAWFALNEPRPVDADQSPAWNPWIFAADTLLPIVDLGQDRYWQLAGASQWIAVALVAAGWILATTAAAGAARALKRV